MSFYALVALINFFTNSILGVFVLLKNRRDKVNVTFFTFTFFAAFWSISYYFWQISNTAETALLWSRILMAGAIFIPVTYLHFIFAFTGLLQKRKIFLIFSYVVFFVFFILNFTSLFVNRVEPILNFRFWPMAGSAYSVFLIVWFFYVIYSIYIVCQKRKEAKGILRVQFSYIIVGMIVGYLGGSTNYFLWYGIPIPPFANIFVSFYILAVAYAIIKHHLMDIKVIATEFFSGLLVIVAFFPIFQIKDSSELFLKIPIFVITLLFAILLIRSVHKEVSRREQVELLAKRLQKASKELKAANKELQRLDEAKSEFLSIASHQLRTPLTIFKGYVSMMVEGSYGPISEKVRKNLSKMYIASERLISLVETLLNISRIEAGRLEFNLQPTDLTEIAKSLVDDFQQIAREKKLKLGFYPEKDLPEVLADGEKIKEVISNFLDNAVKYTEKGEITVSLHQESRSAVLSCQDTGRGIEPDDISRLFNKFVRGKGMMQVHTEGTGLGLYFGRMVVENMGGRIWAESPGKNQGSKFSFSLPLADKQFAKKIK